MTIHDIHTETCTNGVDIGVDGGAQGIIVDSLGSACSFGVHIENMFALQVGDLLLRNITSGNHAIKDEINGFDSISETGGAVGLYYRGHPGTNTILTTATGVPTSFGSGGLTVTGTSTLTSLRPVVNLTTVSGTVTVTLDMTKGNQQQVVCTGSGAGITLQPTNIQSGMEMTFVFVQVATGTACTVAYPSNMHGAVNVSSTLSSVSTQKFVVSNHGTDLYGVAPPQPCTSSCGAP
jgi:hypothetical protein